MMALYLPWVPEASWEAVSVGVPLATKTSNGVPKYPSVWRMAASSGSSPFVEITSTRASTSVPATGAAVTNVSGE